MKSSFTQFFRIILVIFSLYFIGDAFSRWDGFSFYASLSEFLPSVSLAFILWSIVSALTAVLLWLSFTILKRTLLITGLKIEFEQLLFCAIIFTLVGAFAWKVKIILWPEVQTTVTVKSAVFFITAVIAVVATLIVRNKVGQWIAVLQDRITPLVWLFVICIIISFLTVSYHVWLKIPDKAAPEANTGYVSASDNRKNIILITFDALAARNMSVYGYQRETTPFIAQWSKNATLFKTAEASSNYTTPAAASLMTGKRVWTHQTYHVEGSKPVRSSMESLPAVLKKHGYFNVAFVVNPFASISTLGMSGSFDVAPPAADFATPASLFGWKFGVVDNLLYRSFGEKIRLHNWILRNEFVLSSLINLISRNIYQTTVPPDKAFNRFLGMLDNNLQRPFFAWIHIFPPHDPYLPPETFRGTFNPSMELRTYKLQEKNIEHSYRYLFRRQPYPDEMQPAVDLMRDYYDEFISYVDHELGIFMHKLDDIDKGNTVVMLTADHGESFEHGYFTHGGPFLFEQVTHIPLIVKEPGQKQGQTVDMLVEQIDVPATILDLSGIPVPHWMEGRSLVPLMRGERFDPRPAFAMNLQDNRSRGHQIELGSIAMWDGDYKIIHYLENSESLLFDLRHDPGEANNIFDHHTEVSRKLLANLKTSLQKANENIQKEY